MKKRESRPYKPEKSIRSGIDTMDFRNEIEPLLSRYSGLSDRETSADRRRFRIIRKMAREILEKGFYPEGKSSEEYHTKFFSEIYSCQ